MSASRSAHSLPAGPAPVIDSHVHFWQPDRLRYPWLSGVPALDGPFGPGDLLHALREPVEAVFVEAGRIPAQAADEVEWVRQLARTRPWIRGAVAHVSLDDPGTAPEAIRRFAADPFVVGVRHNVQDEEPGFTAGAGFREAVRLLGEAGLAFDACVRQPQLDELAELAAACPRTRIVLDHLGKPSVPAVDSAWRSSLRRLARQDNVVCKLSGLATEAAPGTEPAGLVAILREALEEFGPDRCLYGGDWPVMTLATTYESWLGLVRTALADLPAADADAVMCANTVRTYRLEQARAPAAGHDGAGRASGEAEPR
ncbi:amidohydrolase family protein [Actinacidiphila rubida]|uniref:L-fuconolactonase n=1 Tax=Actinacidiphila rubida TaxID=310780 RepID=A0A1H8SEL0_9ACTN|nr:amidohydrolase family protein [Actinacidiphila rubida]SEO76784.1 L-fuconolactonase [Actinacidiphila rubida]